MAREGENEQTLATEEDVEEEEEPNADFALILCFKEVLDEEFSRRLFLQCAL